MAKINIPEGEGMEAKRIWQLAPHLGAAMGAMGEAVYAQTSLSVREREVARMRVAQLNECHV
ncbi:carboxymuconolactone decarboxylase family protein [Ilumatobacter sp.]|uniref:carboxymuconolactone decarboxylase family protein n=1 Tax=Ilumatobacter sp. TaxID=1967498 RepID=UPI003C4E4D61